MNEVVKHIELPANPHKRISRWLARLGHCWTKLQKPDAAMLKTWVDVLGDLPPERTEAVVLEFCRSDREDPPSPGQIRARVEESLHQPERGVWERMRQEWIKAEGYQGLSDAEIEIKRQENLAYLRSLINDFMRRIS